MLDLQLIDRLADLCGMPSSYSDWDGSPVEIDSNNKTPLLAAMGFDVSSDKAIKQAIARHESQLWSEVLPPVTVVHQNKALVVELRCQRKKMPQALTLTITLENGDQIVHQADLNGAAIKDRTAVNGYEYCVFDVTVPEYVPLGYHTITVTGEGVNQTGALIMVPAVCFEPEALKEGNKIWGTAVQLYCVRTERNWGMGDLTDLGALTAGMGEHGADFVGLNPVHALYPTNPLHCSPYSPSTRLFDNVLYIDPEQVEGFAQCDTAQKLMQQHAGILAELRQNEFVQYDQVAPLKMSVLEALFAHFNSKHLKKNDAQAQAFAQFCAEKGNKLELFALFEALFEHFRKLDMMSWGWRCWPKAYQNPNSAEVATFAKENEDRVTFFKYLQWLMDLQMHQAQQQAKDAGMMVGIYRDLAVGVDSNGADVWMDPSIFVMEASTGAPPDGLGPMGQDWGLPPFNPMVLRERAYQPFIELIRNNMRNCGALRIDHAMGLFRLWWCPNGDTENKGAKFGCYVHYPLQDLLGIIKLESHRNQCLVFGEDLGVVPQEITDSLPPARMYGSVMGIFQQIEEDQYLLPEDYKVKALAMLACHDTPTLKGWWDAKDVDIMESLGFFTEERSIKDKADRELTRKAVLNTLRMINELPQGIDPNAETAPAFNREIMERFYYYLMLSESQIAAIQLEDCMLIESPVNVPGTSDEYPNWRRRLTDSVSEMLAKEENQRFFANLSGCRKA